MSDADLTSGVTYHNPASGSTPDGTYEVTNIQDTSTGNDAPCRKITIETAVAPSKSESVYAICWKDGATHNPATQCPLTNVSFCVESKRHGDSDSGLTDGVVFVIRQGGKIYATATQSVGVNWKRASGTYTSASFTWVNGTGNPNFTATGTAIEFGFALKLSVPKDGTPYDVVLFDNLCITRSVAASCVNSLSATVSGITFSLLGSSSQCNTLIGLMNSVFSSTLVLTQTVVLNKCGYIYNTGQVMVSGVGFYTVRVTASKTVCVGTWLVEIAASAFSIAGGGGQGYVWLTADTGDLPEIADTASSVNQPPGGSCWRFVLSSPTVSIAEI